MQPVWSFCSNVNVCMKFLNKWMCPEWDFWFCHSIKSGIESSVDSSIVTSLVYTVSISTIYWWLILFWLWDTKMNFNECDAEAPSSGGCHKSNRVSFTVFLYSSIWGFKTAVHTPMGDVTVTMCILLLQSMVHTYTIQYIFVPPEDTKFFCVLLVF